MKKLSFLTILLFPFLLNAQYGWKNCHTDLVFGFDVGDRGGWSKDTEDPNFFSRYDNEHKKIIGMRVGTNLAYPIANRLQLVTGFRLADQFVKTYAAPLITHKAYTEKKLHDLYLEIPFRARRQLGYSKKANHFFIEGGLDASIYIASHVKDEIEQAFDRAESYTPISLSANLSAGYEMEMQNENSFFIQPIFRIQLTPKTERSKMRFYHVGIETGFRF